MSLPEEDHMDAQAKRAIANGDSSNAADGGCYQANGDSSNPLEHIVSFNLETKKNGERKKRIKNKISINIGNNGAPAPHKVCTMPTWLETLESEDAYAALALMGAAVSVAVAYNCYRQLG